MEIFLRQIIKEDETMARRRDEDDEDDGHRLIEEEDARPIIDSKNKDDLSLDEILHLYKQPINEEQAWAVCYQCCRSLLADSAGSGGAGDFIRIYKDGSVRFYSGGVCDPSRSCTQVIESLGVVIYKALDYGLKENEERELSPPLEQLIDLMTNVTEAESDSCADEGYDATEEDEDERQRVPAHPCRIRGVRDIIKLCALHLATPADAPDHYQAVCRALYAETKELRSFLEKIQSAKENLRKMEVDTVDERGRELNELQNADWPWFWVQVMRDLRNGVKLKKVQERQYNPLPIEFQLTPYEMLMDDIRSKRYKLRKVSGDIPPRLKKSAHEVILEFIRSRPPLNPVSARKLKPQAERPPSLHERILEEIKSERKLRPVSPDMIRRSRFAVRPLSMSQSFDSSDVCSSDGARKASSTLSLADGVSLQQNVSSGFQRKRLQAPTLSELDSSDSEDETAGQRSASCSSISTSMVDDTSPESVLGKKTPPMFLPISSTPQPERRQQAQRRHSIEKETPTSVRHFLPPSRHSSRSLEEFCFPVECLALTVEEVMHIRQVLVKAELEKFQQYKDIYNAMKKGKLCFCCRTKRFSFFTWSYTCQFCKRPVCSQCCKKMRLPSKPYGSLPIYSLGPSTSSLKRDASSRKPEKPSTSLHRASLQRTVSRLSKHTRQSSSSQEEMELPKELKDDWSTMEVCVDCKKFISDIIASSKHSLSLANKRARWKHKTQSLIMASETSAEYRPSERTINEV
ncbi:protein spire homolog 1-like isoform X2 [Carassius carassius]|uniref:protein spire homolog 1-like isoform X2 n=1 Tax=Carassius carassius TaxID=217509 RepID=UPI00286952FA|nr:protein spire homolog 1-like isoform X2 [Carassius carassius]